MISRLLISGSIAFDFLMTCSSSFSETFSAQQNSQTGPAFNNCCFVADTVVFQRGGCGANIAFNLVPFFQIGIEAEILSAVGHDAEDYSDYLKKLGVNMQSVVHCKEMFTAQAFILTDKEGSQLNTFHPGAMLEAHRSKIQNTSPTPANTLGIVSPNSKEAMLKHAQQFIEKKIPYIFDPGQALSLFDSKTLQQLISHAKAVVVNNTEAIILEQRSEWSTQKIAEKIESFIITQGANGSLLYNKNCTTKIPVAPVSATIDPTGCGDAYRSGLLVGLSLDWPWVDCARLGSVLGAITVESTGTQNHSTSLPEIIKRLQLTYSDSPWHTYFDKAKKP